MTTRESLLEAALRRDTAAAAGRPQPPPLPPTRARRLASGGGTIGAFSDVECTSGGGGGGGEGGGGGGFGHWTSCVSGPSAERLRSIILCTALVATTLAVSVTTGATRELLRSFASPFSSRDEYRVRHFNDASRAGDASSTERGHPAGLHYHDYHLAANPGEDVGAAQRRWMAALHGSARRANEELEALHAYNRTKLPPHPDDGTPRAVPPGA